MPMRLYTWSRNPLLPGDEPREDARKTFPRKSYVMWNFPRSTAGQTTVIQMPKDYSKKYVHSSKCAATGSGGYPGSISSSFNVIFGLILFSSTYDGVNMVQGKQICTPMPYITNSECNASASPVPTGRELLDIRQVKLFIGTYHVAQTFQENTRSTLPTRNTQVWMSQRRSCPSRLPEPYALNLPALL